MSASKEGPSTHGFFLRLAQALGHGGWFLTWTVLLTVLTILVCVWLWQNYGTEIVNDPRYCLTEERLQVSPQPAWIRRADVKAEAMLRGRLQGADMRDPELAPRIYRAFLNSPWVKDVLLVNKSSSRGRGVNVRLVYRKPIAMVVVEAKKFANVNYERGLYPVDVEGHVLPPEFTLEEANAYPKIGNVKTRPAGSFGENWGDKRVRSAAEIIELLASVWGDLKLYRVDVPELSELPLGAPYRLVRVDGQIFIWGSPPGEERPGEENPAEKIVRLRQSHKNIDPSVHAASQRQR